MRARAKALSRPALCHNGHATLVRDRLQAEPGVHRGFFNHFFRPLAYDVSQLTKIRGALI